MPAPSILPQGEPAPRPLFLYGTLLCRPLLAWLLTGDPHRTSLIEDVTAPARLRDFVRTPLRGCDYPALVPASGREVQGLLLRLQSTSQRRKVDDFEGETYRVTAVRVRSVGDDDGEGKEIEADAYVWAGQPEMVELGKEWDLEKFEMKG
ncbi:hypothetical protein BKA93DRAFT_828547 [Sparassis latifolia]